MVRKLDIGRRRFLRSAGAVGMLTFTAGCSSDSEASGDAPTSTSSETAEATPTATEEETPTETAEPTETPEGDRPANYRLDMHPQRNEALRERLGQYVEGDVGELVEDHPAFDYSTDSDRDDRGVDFAALELYRDSNFDIRANNHPENPMERMVEAYVNENLFTDAKIGAYFVQHDVNAPTEYSVEGWLNAETVEESLDYGHMLAMSIVDENGNRTTETVEETGAVIREAYKRHHDFDVLAWTTRMGGRTSDTMQPVGLLYSPDDDKVRNFNYDGDEGDGETSLQMHCEIQDWSVIQGEGPGNKDRFHPLLFHTERRNNQGTGFEEAKRWNASAITSIASDENTNHMKNTTGVFGNPPYAMTTGLQEQVSRTLFEYNTTEESDFQHVWDLANLTVMLEDYHGDGRYVLDTGVKNDDYSGHFTGDVAVYEIADESILDAVWTDQSGEYDNFEQSYDDLQTV